jgi:hypothetical protein
MKLFYTLMLCFIVVILNKSYAAAGDKVVTSSKVVANVRLQDTGASATYYFVSETGSWDVPNCPGVVYAYLEQNSKIAEATLSVALTSKAADLPISFHGICGSGSGDMQYLQIKYVIF